MNSNKSSLRQYQINHHPLQLVRGVNTDCSIDEMAPQLSNLTLCALIKTEFDPTLTLILILSSLSLSLPS